MTDNELLVRLRDLHEDLTRINIDLDKTEVVDESTVETLGQLVTDVNKLVDQAKMESDPAQTDDHRWRLRQRLREIEDHHPRVINFAVQLEEVLNKIGV